MTTQRDPTFDILKGVAILLMMTCHLVYKGGWIHQAVFSFRMPLFFLIAGYFTKNVAQQYQCFDSDHKFYDSVLADQYWLTYGKNRIVSNSAFCLRSSGAHVADVACVLYG